MKYPKLVRAIIEHLDEWHTTDKDGVRRCDLAEDCILDQFQGSTYPFVVRLQTGRI